MGATIARKPDTQPGCPRPISYAVDNSVHPLTNPGLLSDNGYYVNFSPTRILCAQGHHIRTQQPVENGVENICKRHSPTYRPVGCDLSR